jgi:cytochrome c2
MKRLISLSTALSASIGLAAPGLALAADAAHGQAVFRQQCGACHAAGEGDGDGEVGPNLAGVIGRKVGGDPNFAYTPALAADKDVWTQASLASFLENPQKAIPGTAMPVNVPSAVDRADLAAYLATVKPAK